VPNFSTWKKKFLDDMNQEYLTLVIHSILCFQQKSNAPGLMNTSCRKLARINCTLTDGVQCYPSEATSTAALNLSEMASLNLEGFSVNCGPQNEIEITESDYYLLRELIGTYIQGPAIASYPTYSVATDKHFPYNQFQYTCRWTSIF